MFKIGAVILAVGSMAVLSVYGQTTNTFPAVGYVGIGTMNPATALDVVGKARTSGGFQYNAGDGNPWWLTGTANGPAVLLQQHVALGGPSNRRGSLGWMDNTGATSEILTWTDASNVGVGTTSPTAPLEVNGNLKLTANSGASIVFADGTTQSTAYTGVSCGGDFAESMKTSGSSRGYEPGDVLVLTSDGKGDVAESSEAYSTMVAGIYSTKPGYVGRRFAGAQGKGEVPLAMVGVVPTKVSAENGPIHRGDLLVTASLKGYAMKGTDRGRMLGAVVGKAMGSLEAGTGTVEVLVTLQ